MSLLDRLCPEAMVEVTVYIGFANMATRCNTTRGIKSQGYATGARSPWPSVLRSQA
jgi:hypothetical protein